MTDVHTGGYNFKVAALSTIKKIQKVTFREIQKFCAPDFLRGKISVHTFSVCVLVKCVRVCV